jgi:hypothetical protein
MKLFLMFFFVEKSLCPFHITGSSLKHNEIYPEKVFARRAVHAL